MKVQRDGRALAYIIHIENCCIGCLLFIQPVKRVNYQLDCSRPHSSGGTSLVEGSAFTPSQPMHPNPLVLSMHVFLALPSSSFQLNADFIGAIENYISHVAAPFTRSITDLSRCPRVQGTPSGQPAGDITDSIKIS